VRPNPKEEREDPAALINGDPLVLRAQAEDLRARSRAEIERSRKILRRIDEVLAQSEHVVADVRERRRKLGLE
jgi:hypothetical protein